MRVVPFTTVAVLIRFGTSTRRIIPTNMHEESPPATGARGGWNRRSPRGAGSPPAEGVVG